MRLIDTRTLDLHEFVGSNVPEYAILSHRWTGEEVSLQEYQSSVFANDDIQSKAGFHKIKFFCYQARVDSIDFGWVDTCCIDKTSSAELSEAINSMYRWYQNAAKCYVYLNELDGKLYSSADVGSKSREEQFQQSQWPTRGWTLQELIAPKIIKFYAGNWEFIGTKESLAETLETTTGIPADVLTHKKPIYDYSVACRFSWASGRTTTREEDLAYCLMGLFDVNMPMLYGEGQKAFIRLQEEILRTSNDHSIFAWKDPTDTLGKPRGLLAESPGCFKNSADYQATTGLSPSSLLVTLTNNGISINVPILASKGHFKAILNCHRMSSSDLSRPSIHLACCGIQARQFSRIYTDTLEDTTVDANRQQIYVRQNANLSLPVLERPITIALKVSTPPWGREWRQKMCYEGYQSSPLMVHSCWVSPQSYIMQSERLNLPESTRIGWSKNKTDKHLASLKYKEIRENNQELFEPIFALPQFPNTPALLIKTNFGEILIGRANDGHIGVQEAPQGLSEAIRKNHIITEGRFLYDLESGLERPKFRNGSEIRVKVLEGEELFSKRSYATVILQGITFGKPLERSFEENMRIYDFFRGSWCSDRAPNQSVAAGNRVSREAKATSSGLEQRRTRTM